MYPSESETTQMKSFIEDQISHPYAEKYIQKPFIDIEKLTLLQYIYNQTEIEPCKQQRYIATTMFVQVALDTHERVAENDATIQQLSVLAGDYYSGMYYFLLSEIEEIDIIKLLATSIKLINEYKMNLYYCDFHTKDELLFCLAEIESLLFTE